MVTPTDLAAQETHRDLLWRHAPRVTLTPDTARAHLGDLLALALTVFPSQDLLPAALEVALTHGITANDATYLALGEALAVPVITADGILARAVGDPGRVRMPADYAAP